MAWFLLLVAGLLEACWSIGLKYTHGFTRLWPSVFTAVSLAVGMYLFARALRTLPLGTAYAVWVGLGVLATTIAGVMLFQETWSVGKVVSLLLLVLGIVGLKVYA